MAKLNEQENAITYTGETHESLSSLLSDEERDFLIKNNGQKVKVEELEGKRVGLYFSAHWSLDCRYFTSRLSGIYEKFSEKWDFEIVFVSADFDEKAFDLFYSTMPWPGLPFSDKNTREKLDQVFQVNGNIPSLVVLDKRGKVITTEGVAIIREYGYGIMPESGYEGVAILRKYGYGIMPESGYPFTPERLEELRANREAAEYEFPMLSDEEDFVSDHEGSEGRERLDELRAEDVQTVESLLVSDERDFVLGHGGRKVPVAELVGKTVGLFFSASSCHFTKDFTQELVEIYNKVLEKGEAFEIVVLSREEVFNEYYASMPWLTLPFNDKTYWKLSDYFDVWNVPNLIILGPDGITLRTDAVNLIRDYGIRAYPFTKERLDVVEAEEKAKREAQTLESLLVSDERNFLIKHGGARVPVAELVGKTVGLYFSASRCDYSGVLAPDIREMRKDFTTEIVKIYNELLRKGEDFEIVFLSHDVSEQDFDEFYARMPWLALPFADNTEKKLSRYFQLRSMPALVILGPDGKTVRTDTLDFTKEYGDRAYPFTKERLDELVAEKKARREAQTLESLLVSDKRNFLIKHGGAEVPVAELVGKTVGLYFSAHWCRPCRNLTPRLGEIYNELLKKGEAFEIVFLSCDQSVEEYKKYSAEMPWLALPYRDKTERKLSRYFRAKSIPTLVILGPDGKTVQTDAVPYIREYADRAYPFTKEWLDELAAEDKAKREAQTLESLLVSDERDFVIKHGGAKVLVSELVGKTVGFYFSTHASESCGEFTVELVEAYNKLKEWGEAFEVVFISSDKDQEAFEDSYKSMPWLALPFGDKSNKDLQLYFRARDLDDLPALVIVGPDGKTLTDRAVKGVRAHGARAYPFTNSRLFELNQSEREKWVDDETDEDKEEDTDSEIDGNRKPAGVICDGDVCYRAKW